MADRTTVWLPWENQGQYDKLYQTIQLIATTP